MDTRLSYLPSGSDRRFASRLSAHRILVSRLSLAGAPDRVIAAPRHRPVGVARCAPPAFDELDVVPAPPVLWIGSTASLLSYTYILRLLCYANPSSRSTIPCTIMIVHIEYHSNGIPDREIGSRRMLLACCLYYV